MQQHFIRAGGIVTCDLRRPELDSLCLYCCSNWCPVFSFLPTQQLHKAGQTSDPVTHHITQQGELSCTASRAHFFLWVGFCAHAPSAQHQLSYTRLSLPLALLSVHPLWATVNLVTYDPANLSFPPVKHSLCYKTGHSTYALLTLIVSC